MAQTPKPLRKDLKRHENLIRKGKDPSYTGEATTKQAKKKEAKRIVKHAGFIRKSLKKNVGG